MDRAFTGRVRRTASAEPRRIAHEHTSPQPAERGGEVGRESVADDARASPAVRRTTTQDPAAEAVDFGLARGRGPQQADPVSLALPPTTQPGSGRLEGFFASLGIRT